MSLYPPFKSMFFSIGQLFVFNIFIIPFRYWASISSFHHSVHALAFAILKKPENNFLLAADVSVSALGEFTLGCREKDFH